MCYWSLHGFTGLILVQCLTCHLLQLTQQRMARILSDDIEQGLFCWRYRPQIMRACHPFVIQEIPHAELYRLLMMADKPSVGVIASIICQVCLILRVCIGDRACSDIEVAAALLVN